MAEGRTGNPPARAWTLIPRIRIRPPLAAIVSVALVTMAAASLLVPAGGLPTPVDNVGIAVGPGNARTPSLAVDTLGRLHVVRNDDVSGERGVYYESSADGTSWSPSVRIDPAGTATYFPRIAVEREPVPTRGRLYVAYQALTTPNAYIYLVASDGGGSWSPPRPISLGPPNTASQYPAIAASGGHVYVAWSDNRDPAEYDIWFRASADAGVTWGPEVQLSSAPQANLWARVEAKLTTVVIAWYHFNSTGATRILSARSDDAGATWTQSILAEAAALGESVRDPELFLDDDLVAHVVWSYTPPSGQTHIVYVRSGDGLAWSAPVAVDDIAPAVPGPTYAQSPSIAGLAGTLWVAWHDYRNGNYDVFATWSADGRTWGDGLRNSNDLRLDDTNRNAATTDDTTNQLTPVLRTGGFGVYAAWEDFRSATTVDIYFGTLDLSPLVITEMQDAPAGDARVEVYNFARAPFPLAGASLVANGQTFDLSPLGSVPARGHVVIGRGTADLNVPLDLGTEGMLVQIVRGPDVLASAGSGTYGVAPDPLPGETTSRYAGTLDYVQAWTRTTTDTFGSRNVAPAPDPAPLVVLNQVMFNGGGPDERFVELILRGAAPVDLTGYRLVGDTVLTLPSGLLGGLNPRAYLFEGRQPAWFQAVGAAGDNVYLYDPGGRLLDMVGWSSAHTAARSVLRIAPATGGLQAYDDASASYNGWAFDQVPSLNLLDLQSDATVTADVGTVQLFPLRVTNLQADAEYVNVDASAFTPWPLRLLYPNGTPLADSPGDADATPDLGSIAGGASVSFLCEVTIPLEGLLGDANLITVGAAPASVPIGRATVRLIVLLYPHFDVTRTVDPTTVYVGGTPPPYNTIAQVTVSVRGAGFPIVTQIPQDVVFQIDESGSMNFNDQFNLRVEAVKNYIDGMRIDDRGALVGFTTAAWSVNNRPLTSTDAFGKALLKGDADTLACSPFCGGGTNIDSALQLGNNILITQGNASRPRVEILLTDGVCEPPCGNTNNLINQAVNNGLVIYTIGLGSGVDAAFLTNIADRTGGKYYFASTPQDLAAIYAEIGTRVNRTAGVKIPNNLVSMIEDDVSQSLTVQAGSFVDPFSGQPRNPSFIQQQGDRTVLQWDVTSIQINETWAVAYNVTSGLLGPQDVALHPDARVAYMRWDGSLVYQTIPQGSLTVLGLPSPPYITATSPPDGTTNVPVDQPIQVVFSEAMTAASVEVTIAPPVALGPAWPSADIVTFSHPDFLACTWYTVEITAGQDQQGESLVPGLVPNPWTFRTPCIRLANYTITRQPERGAVRVDGQVRPVPAQFQWPVGEVHDVEAFAFDMQAPSRWAYRYWDDGGLQTHSLTVGPADVVLTAVYALQHPAALDLVGLDANHPVNVTATLFSTTGDASVVTAWSGWSDDGAPLSVDDLIPGGPGERFITQDATAWIVTAPLTATVRYYHQFAANVLLVGLDEHDVRVVGTAFGAAAVGPAHDLWSAWLDADSSLSVDGLLAIGPRERYRTLDAVGWTMAAPLNATVLYRHQFRPQVTLVGLDDLHTVGASWHLDGGSRQAAGLFNATVNEWADAGTILAFDSASTGSPPLRAQDPTSFAIGAFDATIRYAAPAPSPPPNWKPLLAFVYAIALLAAGAAFSTRSLDHHVPRPRDGDVRARRFAWRNLTVGQKFNELSLAQVEDKVHRDRWFTRLLLTVPFAAAEGGIGVLSLSTGVFRIPEANSWLPLGFWVNTGLLIAGVLAGIAVWRQGYRMTEETLLRLAEARARVPPSSP